METLQRLRRLRTIGHAPTRNRRRLRSDFCDAGGRDRRGRHPCRSPCPMGAVLPNVGVLFLKKTGEAMQVIVNKTTQG